MTDIRVCSSCHSIHRQRNAPWYTCGSAQQTAAAAGEMAALRSSLSC